MSLGSAMLKGIDPRDEESFLNQAGDSLQTSLTSCILDNDENSIAILKLLSDVV